MINYLALLVAIGLSAIAAYFSVIGLTTIFAASFWPVVIMGGTLEVTKVVAVSWTYRNWNIAPFSIKAYLVTSIIVLMFITSMGTFGYLSKAHIDQTTSSSDVVSQLAIYDEKIKVAKENIDANRKALKQYDDAVDQIMGRSDTEKGAEKAVVVRRSQQKDRARLQEEIQTYQKEIGVLNDTRAPLAAQVRKVEAEVGPLKFIAELFYEKVDTQFLDKTVRWVIILIVIVFDPLAIILLIAANIGLSKTKIEEQQIEEQQDTQQEIESRARLLKELTGKIRGGTIMIDKDQIREM
jgi:cell division protein FtsB